VIWLMSCCSMRSTDPKFFEIFAAVARLGSIRKAAMEFGVSTSNVSRLIVSAEEDLNAKLIERRPSGVVLTDAGRVMREHAMRQIEERRRLRARIARATDRAGDLVRIRCGEGFLADLVERGIREIVKTRADIGLSVDIGSTAEIVDAVSNGEADIGIAYAVTDRAPVKHIAAFIEPLCAIVPRTYSVTNTPCDLSVLNTADMALLPKTHGVRQLLEQSAERHGILLRPAFTSGSISALLHFVRAGHGITFLPRFAAEIPRQQGLVRVLELAHPTLNAAKSTVFIRSQRRLPSTVETVLGSVLENMHSFGTIK